MERHELIAFRSSAWLERVARPHVPESDATQCRTRRGPDRRETLDQTSPQGGDGDPSCVALNDRLGLQKVWRSSGIEKTAEGVLGLPTRFPGRASTPKNAKLDLRAPLTFRSRDERPSMPTIGFEAVTCIADAVPSAVIRARPSAR